jgi:anti-sigma factor (TIGR02949 family)
MPTDASVSCEELIRELPDYLDRELPSLRLAELRRHLDQCDHCLQTYRFERSLLDRVRGRLSRVALPDGFTARLLASIGAGRE